MNDACMKRCVKGQYFTFDAVMGAIIFMVTMGILLNYWYTMQATIDARDETAYRACLRMADQLVSTPGTPVDWESSTNVNDVVQLGLITSWDNTTLSYDKWTRFKDWSDAYANPGDPYYVIADELFRAGGDYKVHVSTFGTGACSGLDEYAGRDWPDDATVVKVRRIVPFKHSGAVCVAEVTVYLWR